MADESLDRELFDAALQDEAPQPPSPVETPPEPAVASEEAPAAPSEPDANVPPWRLREEAEARRMAEERARSLEERLNRYEQFARSQQPNKGPDFFENPEAAVNAAIQRAMQQTLGPFAQQTQKAMLHVAREATIGRLGADGEKTLDTAETAFLDAMNNRSLDPADYHRVVGAPNRYAAVVQWHKKQSALSTVGDDPEAWFNKQLESRMSDPKFQAQFMERVRGGATSRSSNVTQLPPSLSRATSAIGNGPDNEGDWSDSSLFAAAREK